MAERGNSLFLFWNTTPWLTLLFSFYFSTEQMLWKIDITTHIKLFAFLNCFLASIHLKVIAILLHLLSLSFYIILPFRNWKSLLLDKVNSLVVNIINIFHFYKKKNCASHWTVLYKSFYHFIFWFCFVIIMIFLFRIILSYFGHLGASHLNSSMLQSLILELFSLAHLIINGNKAHSSWINHNLISPILYRVYSVISCKV